MKITNMLIQKFAKLSLLIITLALPFQLIAKRKDVYVQDHYQVVTKAMQEKEWNVLINNGKIILKKFSLSPYASEIKYFLGISHFEKGELEKANNYFSTYLEDEMTPKYFEEAIEYKFQIAKKYEEGARMHLFGWKRLPKWIPAKEEAIELFDEVITTLPRSEIAAESLYRKASLLFALDQFKESTDTYQILIRRFPKHHLAIESYLNIGAIYVKKCKKEFPDPTFLDLAQINYRKFRNHFPGEERISVAEKQLVEIEDELALELFEIGEFYERTKKAKAACIYYKNITDKFPNAKVAKTSRKKLEKLNYKELLLKEKASNSESILVENIEDETK